MPDHEVLTAEELEAARFRAQRLSVECVRNGVSERVLRSALTSFALEILRGRAEKELEKPHAG